MANSKSFKAQEVDRNMKEQRKEKKGWRDGKGKGNNDNLHTLFGFVFKSMEKQIKSE